MIGQRMPRESIFFMNTDGRGAAPSIPMLEKYCNDWMKYLSDFEAKLGAGNLPYDNEMSAVGSLSSAISRYNKDCFIVQEAIVKKVGNLASNSGRADMWVASGTDGGSELYFEAKRHRKIIDTKKGLDDAFSKSVHSLIGRGFRDRAKTTGKVHRVRNSGQVVMLLLAHLRLSDEFTRTDAIDQLKVVFQSTVIIKKTNESRAETTKKNMKKFPTIGFLFVPDTDSQNALLSTMTLL